MSDGECGTWHVGRVSTQAPEIDGVVYLSETEAEPGEFVDVTITDATEYDLVGMDVYRKTIKLL